uniref:Uncharacterized protein n=1 Tax=Romanomermis culicivorax TaxID=13658 RepID=A0A915JUY4_ROMCU
MKIYAATIGQSLKIDDFLAYFSGLASQAIFPDWETYMQLGKECYGNQCYGNQSAMGTRNRIPYGQPLDDPPRILQSYA